MEQLCLQHYGVSQMETREMKTVDGGWWQIGVAVLLYVLSEWDDISAGFSDGISGREYNYNPCEY